MRTKEQVAAYKKLWQQINASRISKERKACYLYKIGELSQRHAAFKRKLAAITPYDVGQLAALVVGEGYITLTQQTAAIAANKRGRIYYSAVVGITNTEPELMIWLESRLGGSVRWDTKRKSPNGNQGKPVANWTVHGRDAGLLCEILLPHLIFKKERARLLVEFFKHTEVPGRSMTDAECHRRTAIHVKFQALKRRW